MIKAIIESATAIPPKIMPLVIVSSGINPTV
jgi:hypothetical protein